MKCENCGGALKHGEVEHSITVDGRKYVDKVPAEICAKCREDFVSAADLKKSELKAAAAIANSGQVSGLTFRFMRNVMGFTAAQLGALLDATPETISRWENGKPVDRAAWVTLGGLVVAELEGRKDALERLQRAASGKHSRAKTVHLDTAS
ncbi:MAG: YgiT-type zinc finger protein [Clostridia bacterium]|nr:YgiT-type zinc finger protein [Deltaproteobacteria bacterium]